MVHQSHDSSHYDIFYSYSSRSSGLHFLWKSFNILFFRLMHLSRPRKSQGFDFNLDSLLNAFLEEHGC